MKRVAAVFAAFLVLIGCKSNRRHRIPQQPCPASSHHLTTPFSSHREIWCHDCRRFYPWPLKPDQVPLVSNNRATRKTPK